MSILLRDKKLVQNLHNYNQGRVAEGNFAIDEFGKVFTPDSSRGIAVCNIDGSNFHYLAPPSGYYGPPLKVFYLLPGGRLYVGTERVTYIYDTYKEVVTQEIHHGHSLLFDPFDKNAALAVADDGFMYYITNHGTLIHILDPNGNSVKSMSNQHGFKEVAGFSIAPGGTLWVLDDISHAIFLY